MGVGTVAEIVALRSPSHAGDSRIADLELLAAYYVAQSVFLDKWIYAKALVVLHWLTLDAMGGGSESESGSGVVGSIKSEKEGDLARSFGSSGLSDDRRDAYFGSTSFGAELLQLWKACLLNPQTRQVGAIAGIITR